MWSWFNCYLSGRHEYGVWCEPGAIFLRCMHCGRRSPGWAVEAKSAARDAGRQATPTAKSAQVSRVIPFGRALAR